MPRGRLRISLSHVHRAGATSWPWIASRRWGNPPTLHAVPGGVSVTHEDVCETPDIGNVSTSYVERQNLTMRMSMRRLTRLTKAFSKKIENHAAMVALHFMHYNYCRIHQSLRVTPAMAAGLTDHVWELEELVALLD